MFAESSASDLFRNSWEMKLIAQPIKWLENQPKYANKNKLLTYNMYSFSSGTQEKLIELDEFQQWHIREMNKAYRGRGQLSMTPRSQATRTTHLKRNSEKKEYKECVL